MKEYIKPEIQYVELITEPVTDFDGTIGWESGNYDVDLP